MHYVIGNSRVGAIARRDNINEAVDCLFHMTLGASDGDYLGALKACAWAIGESQYEPRVSRDLLGWYLVRIEEEDSYECTCQPI